MSKRPLQHPLALWMNGDKVGTWRALPGVDELAYDADWVASPQGRPLSLSLPYQPGNAPLRSLAVRNYFDNLLPDSQPIRERLARRFGTRTTEAFELLTQIGRDCVGALQIVPEGAAPGHVKRLLATPLNEAGVAQLLRAATSPGPLAGTASNAARSADDFRISIAGAQEKTALLWHQDQWWRPSGATPTTHILKLPLGMAGAMGNMGLDLRDSIENEWLCAQLLQAYGVPMARCHPLTFEDQHVLAVERFDRAWSGAGQWLMRLPQEDMCQATATPSYAKYEADGGPGIDRILGVLSASRRRGPDRETFFRAQLLFWLLCAPDGHAKNFSIALHAGGAFSLAPLYDVISAYPFMGKGARQIAPQRVRLAMALRVNNPHWRVRDITRRHWLEVGRRNGVVSDDGRGVDALMQDIVDKTPAVLARVAAQLPKGFPSRIAEPVLTGLRSAVAALARAGA